MSSSEKDLSEKIDELRNNLIDLSDENNFLNFIWDDYALPIIDVDFYEFFSAFVMENKTFELVPELTINELEDSLKNNKDRIKINDLKKNIDRINKFKKEKDKLEYYSQNTLLKTPEFYINRNDELVLKTPLNDLKHSKILNYIDLKYKNSIAHEGVANLFLALGFLEHEKKYAPLILIPVSLTKTNNKYILSYDNYTNIKLNEYLEIKLEDEKIDFPISQIKNEMDMNSYLTNIKNIFSDNGDLKPFITLSLFDLKNIELYEDLDITNLNYELKEELDFYLSDEKDAANDSNAINEEDIDLIDEKLKYNVYDADSSQLAVIEEAKLGKNIIIDTHSSTNKSQTIINLIAEILANKRTVLYVSEKMEAIKDIESRLDSLGLKFAYLDLYANNYNNSKLINEIIKTIDYDFDDLKYNPEYFDIKVEKVNSLKSKINDYLRFINTSFKDTGFTPYYLMGFKESNLLKIEKSVFDLKSINMNNLSNIDKRQYDEIFSDIKEIKDIYQEHIFPVLKNKFRSINSLNVNDEEFDSLLDIIPNLKKSIKELNNLNNDLEDIYGIQKLNMLKDYNVHFDNIEILNKNPNIMGNDYQDINNYIKSLENFQNKTKEYGTIEELEKNLTKELYDSKNDLKYYMDELNKLENNIADLNHLFVHFEDILSSSGIKKLNSLKEIENSIDKIEILTKNPSKVENEKELEKFLDDMGKFQKMNTDNSPLSLLKFINDTSVKTLENTLERVRTLISNEHSIQTLENSISKFNMLNNEIGLNKFNYISDLDDSFEKMDILLKKPILINKEDDLAKFYGEYEIGYKKFSELTYEEYYNSMNKDLNDIQNNLIDEVSKSAPLETKLHSIKEELKELNGDLDYLSERYGVKKVSSLKEIDEFLDKVEILTKANVKIDTNDRKKLNDYIQLMDDVKNQKDYTKFSPEKIKKVIISIMQVDRFLNDSSLKYTIFDADIQHHYNAFKPIYADLESSPIDIKDGRKIEVMKGKLDKFKASKDSFLRRILSNKEELKAELKMHYKNKDKRNLRISDEELIRDYEKYFKTIKRLNLTKRALESYATGSNVFTYKNYKDIDTFFRELLVVKKLYSETKKEIPKYAPQKTFVNSLDNLALLRLKLNEINNMNDMDNVLSKYFPNSYNRFNTDLNELYLEYSAIENFNKLFEEGFFKKPLSYYKNIDSDDLNESLDKIRRQKSKIYYYIRLINNNSDLEDSNLSLKKIFVLDLNELLSYCDRLYDQINAANNLFNETSRNYELKEMPILMENYRKINSFDEIKFLVDSGQFEQKLDSLNTDFNILSGFNLIYENNIDLIQRYYMDIWNGNKTSLDDIASRNKVCLEFTELYNEKYFNKDVLKFLENSPENIEKKMVKFKKTANQLFEKAISFDKELVFYNGDLSDMKINDLSKQNIDILSFIKSLKKYKSKLSYYKEDDLVDFDEITLNSIEKTSNLSKDLNDLYNGSIFKKYDISFKKEKEDLEKINSTSEIFNEIITIRDSINSREDIINNHFYHKDEKFNLWNGPLTPLNKLNDKIEMDKEFTILLKEKFFKEKVLSSIDNDPNSFNKFISEINEDYNKLTILINNLSKFNIIKNSHNDFKDLDFNSMKDISSNMQANLNEIKNNYQKIDFQYGNSDNSSKDSSSFNVEEFSKNIISFENIIDSEFVKSTKYKLFNLSNHNNKLNTDLSNLKELTSLKDRFDSISLDNKYFNHICDGYNSDISKLNQQVDINKKYEKLLEEGFFNEKTEQFLEDSSKFDKFNTLFSKEKDLVKKIIPDLESVDSIYEDNNSFLDEKIFGDVDKNVDILNKNMEDLKYWRSYQVFCMKYSNNEFNEFINALNEDEINPGILLETFNYNFANNLLNEIDSNDLAIDLKYIEDYKKLDKEIVDYNKFRVIKSIKENKPNFDGDIDNDQYIAQSKFNSQVNAKNKKPIREFLIDTIDYVKLIKPLFIMNPLSVAQYLDHSKFKSYFDYVIIDDINNLKAENSISSLLRSKTKIIFSDNKFSSEEGLSNLLSSKFTNKSLKWSYSQDESLIEYLNENYYENDLIIHKSNMEKSEFGLKLHYCKDSKFNSRHKENELEALNIVDYAINHFKSNGFRKTLGIIAFTKEQRDLIIKVLLDKLEKYPDLVQFFNPFESFYVKDINEVYEKRDVVLISLAYGFDELENLNTEFDFTNDFAFNLALTRSLEKTIIFSNFKSEDLIIKKDSSDKERFLKELLNFIDERKLYLDFDFTENYISEEDVMENEGINESDSNNGELSLFMESIYEFLKENGFEVKKLVGINNNCIDLVVVDENDSNKCILAIESDGDNYYNFATLKDRQIIHINELDKLGWNYYHIYASDWNQNREESKEKLLDKIKEAMEYDNFAEPEIVIEDEGIEIDLEDVIISDEIETGSQEEIQMDDVVVISEEDIELGDDVFISEEDIELGDDDISLVDDIEIELADDINILSFEESHENNVEMKIENIKILLLNN